MRAVRLKSTHPNAGAPDHRWHIGQLHRWGKIGSPVTEYRMLPQTQPPVYVCMLHLPGLVLKVSSCSDSHHKRPGTTSGSTCFAPSRVRFKCIRGEVVRQFGTSCV